MPPSVPVARLGAIDARARTRLPNEIDMTIVDSGRESRVAAAARTAGIASASSSPGRAPEPAPRGFAAHTIGEEHFYGHMLSGALAGTTEHCAMFPLDTIKTRMQTATTSAVAGATLGGSTTVPSQSSARWIPRLTTIPSRGPVASIRAAASGVVGSHGVAGLYRGVAAVGIGAGPAHALYFATYEHMKHALASDDGRHHPFHHAFAGACATVVGDAVQTPVDTVKQRLQMHNSPYVGVWDCVKRTCESQGGVRALYRSYPTTLAMNVPFTAIHFTAYESSKIALRDLINGGKDVEEESFFVQFTAGGLAGGLAAGITTPLDVVKTRMQTHCEVAECEMSSMAVKGEMQPGSGKGVCAVTGDAVHCKQAAAAAANSNGGINSGLNAGGNRAASSSPSPYGSSNFWAVLRTIAKEEGAWALTRGLGPRVLFHIPAGAISWGTYEAGKRMLGITGAGLPH